MRSTRPGHGSAAPACRAGPAGRWHQEAGRSNPPASRGNGLAQSH
jgi:hypothetical protein